MRERLANRVGFVTSLAIKPEAREIDTFPFTIPAIRNLNRQDFHPAVTFLIVENGSGKSTLIEAMGIRLNFEELGGEGFRNRFNQRLVDGGLQQFEILREILSSFPNEAIEDDYENASHLSNLARSRGVQGSGADFLICFCEALNLSDLHFR